MNYGSRKLTYSQNTFIITFNYYFYIFLLKENKGFCVKLKKRFGRGEKRTTMWG